MNTYGQFWIKLEVHHLSMILISFHTNREFPTNLANIKIALQFEVEHFKQYSDFMFYSTQAIDLCY